MTTPPLRRGGVFLVKDDSLSLPPETDRELHRQRTEIIVSGDATNLDPDWPILLVVPTSGSRRFKTEFCVPVAAGTANMTKKCWVRTPCPQPMLKDDIGDYFGQMPPAAMDVIDRALLTYLGMLD